MWKRYLPPPNTHNHTPKHAHTTFATIISLRLHHHLWLVHCWIWLHIFCCAKSHQVTLHWKQGTIIRKPKNYICYVINICYSMFAIQCSTTKMTSTNKGIENSEPRASIYMFCNMGFYAGFFYDDDDDGKIV